MHSLSGAYSFGFYDFGFPWWKPAREIHAP